MHLLDATMFWGPAGGVRRVVSTKHAFVPSLGWYHSVVAPGADGIGEFDCGGVLLPTVGGQRVLLRPQVATALIERLQPDIVEAADPYTLGHAALAAARRLRVPAVAFCHSHLPSLLLHAGRRARDDGSPLRRWSERAARSYLARLYERFDLVLAPSRWVADDLRQADVPNVVQQPLGVDCSVFTPERRDPAWRARLVREFGLPPSTRLLVYVGRFAPEKNLHVLCAAVEALGSGYALLAMGLGGQPPSGANVRVLPLERDTRRIARLLASADVFVHAGNRETFGLAVLEAMACGTPVVASGDCGSGELVRGAGLTLASQAPSQARSQASSQVGSQWAEAIAAQCGDSALPLAARALRRARAHDWPRVLRGWLQRYASMVAASSPRLAAAVPGTRRSRPALWDSR